LLTAPRPSPLRLALIIAILVSAGLFAVGVAIERDQEDGHKEATAAEPTPAETGESPEGGTDSHAEGETAESSEAGTDTHSEGGEAEATETRSESSEDILGINPEATGLVIAAVVAAVLLALAVWVSPLPVVLLAVIGFGLVFAAFDVREVFHQIDESREGLAVLAGVLALVHLTVAALALLVWRSPTTRSQAVASG
jgi:MFS superfamily sulfate permease-like transporter